MDRIALSKRLEGLSRVFIAGSPYHRDLKAMAEVLSKVDDEKFATILDASFTPDATDKDAVYGAPAFPGGSHPGVAQRPFSGQPGRGKGILTDEKLRAMGAILDPDKMKRVVEIIESVTPEQVPGLQTRQPVAPPAGVKPIPGLTRSAEESDKDVGLFWNREASEAIQNNLLRDVVGMTKAQIEDTHRHLDRDQVPDGTHDGEKASNLKPEQTPKLSDVLDSGIVQKSHGAVKKEAGSIKGPGVPDGTGPHGGTKKCQLKEDEKEASGTSEAEEDKSAGKKELSPSEQAALDKAKKSVEEGSKKTEKGLKEVKKLAPSDKPESEADKPAPKADKPEDKKEAGLVEGIELTAPMDDVTLDAAEQEKLSKLFA